MHHNATRTARGAETPGWIAVVAAAYGRCAQGLREAAWRLAGLLARRRSRRALAALDDRLLRDIGLTRVQAEREAAKSFWWL
jgi:uncharacterized protein YjiS (DUF1127 family)